MNENRSVFALNGVTGMAIATGLLISILVGLTIWGVGVQKAMSSNFYEVKDAKSIKMIDTTSASHIVDVK